MTTIDIFKKNQLINDELRVLSTATTPQEKTASANKIQDIVTSLCCELIDIQNGIIKKEAAENKEE